jgi:hypothetical protein
LSGWAELAHLLGMNTTVSTVLPHPEGEQPSVEEFATTAETFAGRVHVERDSDGLVTPLGQLPFFIEYLKQAGQFAGWVADCPLTLSSPNAPSKPDLLGTVLLSVLSGHYRYAHITALRYDAVNPRLLGMKKVVVRTPCVAAWRRSTKRRVWRGCRRISTIAPRRC